MLLLYFLSEKQLRRSLIQDSLGPHLLLLAQGLEMMLSFRLVLCQSHTHDLAGAKVAFLQVYPEGIRHIRADKRVNEWRTPGKRVVVRCALNERQVVIALTGGEIVYFEMDASGQLNEYTERKEMNCDVVSMSLGTVPPGEQRSRFLAVGLADQTVRIISLDPSVSNCIIPYFTTRCSIIPYLIPGLRYPSSFLTVNVTGVGTH